MTRWLGLFFVIIGIASVWIFFSGNHFSMHKKSASTNGSPIVDGYMTEAHFTQYDKLGQVHTNLYTPKMTHYNKDNISYFDHPQLVAYSNNRTPWLVRAQYGKAIHDGDEVDLWGDVKIHQPTQPNIPDTLIQTETMVIYPHRSYAKTEQPVTITRPDAYIQAIGMEAYFKIGVFKLLSTVRGVYEPPSKINS